MIPSIRTDLAMEARELNPDIQGIREENESSGRINISRITIESDEAARKIGKEKGEYITLDVPELEIRPIDLFDEVARCIAKEISALIKKFAPCSNVLIVGLGNRSITPDSLGPRVTQDIYVTRHIKEYLPDIVPQSARAVSAICPGVLGVTGVETMEVIKGVVEHVKPDLIIAIDSLASRRAARINTTIQLSDTGIHPGAGVGNNRAQINKESLGVPVIALGVPLVVFASTISQDTISLIADETGLHGDEEKLKHLAQKVIDEHMGQLIVTPKDIDSIVEDMSKMLAQGINMALFESDYDNIRALIA